MSANTDLQQSIYTESIKLRGYTRPTSTLSALSASDSAKVLRRLAQELTKGDHIILAEAHAKKYAELNQTWSTTADQAAMSTFGRAFRIEDYKISAIGREEFSEHHKSILRHAAQNMSKHKQAAMAHFVAAGYSAQKALNLTQAARLEATLTPPSQHERMRG